MSKFICDICNSEFLTKPTLCKHQKTAKFCLRIKKEQNNEIVIEKNEKCIYCEEEFKSKGYLNRHYEICKVKKEKEEEKYKKNLLEKINNLENLLEENHKRKNEEILDFNKIIQSLKKDNQSQKEELLVLKKELKIKDNFIDILQSKINKDTKLYTVSYLKMVNEESEETI